MPWNPATYNVFKSERFAPFYDLLALIEKKTDLTLVDLGCGTGEMTRRLADALPDSRALGIDSSAEMLAGSMQFTNDRVRFEQRTIQQQLAGTEKFDLVFSNAALQWVDDHQTVIPQVISLVKPGGQLAIQMPDQHRNILNHMLLELSAEPPFSTEVNNWQRESPVLTVDAYAEILFRNGGQNITALEKVYPVVASSSDELIEWVSATTMRPYMERLSSALRDLFVQEFKRRVSREFDKTPVFYPFRRIIISATF